jgi:plastocyanin domain-containing protein
LVLTDRTLNEASAAAESAQTGPAPQPVSQAMALAATTPAMIVGNKQIAVMKIVGFDYVPNRFTVKRGVPVEWRIDASEAAGCGRILIAPALGVRKLLSSIATTSITFTPQQTGEFAFNCGMGMMTPGSRFTVVPNES